MIYYCLSFDHGVNPIHIEVNKIEVKSRDKAWEEVEESIVTNSSHDILLSEKELTELQRKIKEVAG
jgi:hypothetical protein